MAFDFQCWNLDAGIDGPTDRENLAHWQKSQVLSKEMYNQWKQNAKKSVMVDGVKYNLIRANTEEKHDDD